LKSHHINAARKHFVTYWVKGSYLSTSNAQAGNSSPYDHVVLKKNVDGIGGDGRQLNDGKAVVWSSSNEYSFPFNPIFPRFGSISFDADFDSYENDHESEPASSLFPLRGRAYYMRLILDVRDASGRRVELRTSGNIEDHRPESNVPLVVANRNVYSDYNWNSIVEFFQIPTKIHTDNTYHSNWYADTNASYSMPFFEASTQVPLCWIKYV